MMIVVSITQLAWSELSCRSRQSVMHPRPEGVVVTLTSSCCAAGDVVAVAMEAEAPEE